MTRPDAPAPATASGQVLFCRASLLLYASLLLIPGSTALATHEYDLPWTVIAALLGLALLGAYAVMRLAGKRSTAIDLTRLSVELSVFLGCVAGLAGPSPNLFNVGPWIVAAAAIVPLAATGNLAWYGIALVAATGVALQLTQQAALVDILPALGVTLFAGWLSMRLMHGQQAAAQALLRAKMSDARFDAIARVTRHALLITDVRFRLLYANHAIQEVIGYSPAELDALPLKQLLHGADLEEHRRKLRYLKNTARSVIFSRLRARRKDGRIIWLEVGGFNMAHDAAVDGLVFSIEDVTARKETESALEHQRSLLRAVLDFNPAMIYAKDAQGRYTLSNLPFQKRFGYQSEEELRGKTTYEIFLNQATKGREMDAYNGADQVHAQDMQVVRNEQPLENIEVQGFFESDIRRWYRTNKYPLRDNEGKVVGMLGVSRDITDRKEYEMRLERLTMHDELTDLPNHRYLMRAITQAITQTITQTTTPTGAAPSPETSRLVILFCDLDFFKSVNVTHGHDMGDRFLLELARRIRMKLEPEELLARFRGDKFVVVMQRCSAEQARQKGEALLRALSTPIILGDAMVRIQLSIGIALLQPHHRAASDLLRDADVALIQAKKQGRNRVEVFDALMHDAEVRRARIAAAIRFALERNELSVSYQPRISATDGSIRGFEMLLRWASLQHGTVESDEFMPLAETSGVAITIGSWAIEQACRQLAYWQRRYPHAYGFTQSISMSMRQLVQASFVSDIGAILERTGVSPEAVELEATEATISADPSLALERLVLLKKMGLRIALTVALDESGGGYLPLAGLKKLPIDTLKIGKTFVERLVRDESEADLLRFVIALSDAQRFQVVVTGVDTPAQRDVLRRHGCRLMQGRVFSAPVGAGEAENMVAQRIAFRV